ncbi:MAG: hypothetical protein LBR53_08385 [Deltaproteobacteria bacterium]|jgi:hypothetical protein|nr:hypothetical protein [Deltaproteobacteria bacterium]
MRQKYSGRTNRGKKISFGKLTLLILILLGLGYLFYRFIAPVVENAEAMTGQVSVVRTEKKDDGSLSLGFSSDTSVSRILQNVLKLWVDALTSGDYRNFHQSLAPSWKAKDTPGSLAQAYMNLAGYKDVLSQFPGRGKLVLLESAPYDPYQSEEAPKSVRDSVGPESPWLIRGEWRTGKTTLNITLLLSLEAGEWKPVGLRLEVYDGSA